MDARFEARRQAILDECTMKPEVFEQVLPRLESFLQPFVVSLCRREQGEHLNLYVSGLLSDLEDKNVESIAYRFGLGRMGLQRFVGYAEWDDAALREQLARQIGQQLGEADAVLVFDPSAFAKSGKQSVGVARQWCGRLGKVENCQVGIFLGYVSRHEHALVDMRLYLPEEWTQDQDRLDKAGVPKAQRRLRTRHQLCLEMLADKGPYLPHGWIAADDEFGKVYSFRRALHQLQERYLLATPSNLLIRDLEVEPPSWCGRRPNRPWQRIDAWLADLPANAWTQVDVRDGAKGPLLVEMVKRRVSGRTPNRQQGHDEVLVVIRYRDRDNDTVVQVDSYFSNAATETSLAEFARVAKAEHRIEECIQRSKQEAGLADYEVRNWKGWHHHMTLSLLASWFLITETKRGKKMDPGDYAPPNPRRDRSDPTPSMPMRHRRANPPRTRTASTT